MSTNGAPQSALQYTGKGALWFDRFTSAGASTGFRFMGNVSELSEAISVEKSTLKSSVTAGAPTLAESITGQTHTLNIKTTEFDAENIAAFVLGNKGTITQTGTAVTGEAISDVYQGRAYRLAHMKIAASPAPVVKVGGSTKTATTDYVIDYTIGAIYIVEGGGIADLADITVDYTYETISWTKVSAAQTGQIIGAMYFKGDPAYGPKMLVDFHRVSLTPNGSFSMINDGWGEFSFNAEVLDDSAVHAAPDNYYRIAILP